MGILRCDLFCANITLLGTWIDIIALFVLLPSPGTFPHPTEHGGHQEHFLMSHLHWINLSGSASGELSLKLDHFYFLAMAHFPRDADSFSWTRKDLQIEYNNSDSHTLPIGREAMGDKEQSRLYNCSGQNIEFWLGIFLSKDRATK